MNSERLFGKTIEEARKLLPSAERHLRENRKLQTLFEDLKRALSISEEAYRKTGAYRLCAECASLGQATCCGRDMELSVSRELLLINLLLGGQIPEKRSFDRGCFFLTEKGCGLLVRPLLCRNFFCPWFKERFPHKKLITLQKAQESESIYLFRIEDYFKALLR